MRFAIAFAALAAVITVPAFAKLPAPSQEAQAKAAETAAKAAWTTKVGAYELCQVQDRIADTYRKGAASAGKELPPALPVPACADPGPFAVGAGAPAAKPLEASEAHSPAATATSPPSTNATEGEISGGAKK